MRAQKAVFNAVLRGDLTRSRLCWLCDEPDDITEFHHAWGYAREDWLRVVEVCRPCHRGLDRVSPEEFAATWRKVVNESDKNPLGV